MQSWLEGRIWVGKGAQATGMTASLRIQSSKADSNTCESFTRSGLKLESMHQESPRSDVFRKGLPSHFWTETTSEASYLGCGEKNSVVQSPLSDESKFCIHLEIKVPESGGRVERHRIHVAWSPVWSFHSQWWFGLPCHLLVLVPLVFLKSTVNAAIFRALHASFCWQAYGDADFIFQQDWHLPTLPKVPKAGSMTMVFTVLDWPANSPDLNPIENLWGIVKRKMRETRPNNADDWRPRQRNLGFHTTSAVPQTDHLHATLNWGSN